MWQILTSVEELQETSKTSCAVQEEDVYDMAAGYAGEEEMFKIKDRHKKAGNVYYGEQDEYAVYI